MGSPRHLHMANQAPEQKPGQQGPQEPEEKPEKKAFFDTPLGCVVELLVMVGAAFVFTFGILHFVAYPYWIPSQSMLETLQVGDNIVGEKITYRTSSPKAGDVITFINPEDATETLVKRVIATEGQTVTLVGGAVYVDGVALDEPYTGGKPSYELARHGSNLSENVSYPYTVPEGCVWVMGDNRTNSLDSRYFGAIEVSSVTSHAVWIFWPLNHFGSI